MPDINSLNQSTPAVNSPWRYAPASDTGITNTTAVVVKAFDAGVANRVTGIRLDNVSATATVVQILSAANVLMRVFVPGTSAGNRHVFDPPLVAGIGEDISVKCVTSGAGILANVVGD